MFSEEECELVILEKKPIIKTYDSDEFMMSGGKSQRRKIIVNKMKLLGQY